MNKTSSKVFLVFKWVVLILVLLALYLPLLMIVLYSFSASRTVGTSVRRRISRARWFASMA